MYFNSEPCSLLKKKKKRKFRWCRCSFEVVTYRGLHCKCGQCQPRLPSLPVLTPSANMVLSLCPLAQWVSLPPVYSLKVAAFLDLPFSLFLVYPVLGSSLGKSLLSPYPSVRGSASLSSLRCGSPHAAAKPPSFRASSQLPALLSKTYDIGTYLL